MICPRCEFENQKNKTVCTNCGYKLNKNRVTFLLVAFVVVCAVCAFLVFSTDKVPENPPSVNLATGAQADE